MIIYAGSLVDKTILEFAKENASAFDSAKLNLEGLKSLYIKAWENGQIVARLHSGDPSIYGAINEQIALLEELGIEYEVVPGVSSFVAAAAALKTELTAPEISQTIIITRLSGRTPVPEAENLKELAKHNATMCIFLSVHKIKEVVKELGKGYSKQTPVAVVYRASRDDEQIIRGTIQTITEEIKKAGVSKTALIIVGEAINNQENVSKLYNKAFSHMYRESVDR